MNEALLEKYEQVELVTCGGPKAGWVYFIACVDSGRCKIGFTAKPVEKRLANLQTGSSGELVMIARHPGTVESERELHARFSDCRLHGEWFQPNDDLRAYILATTLAMSLIALQDGLPLEPWQIVGIRTAIDHLGGLPEGMAEMIEELP